MSLLAREWEVKLELLRSISRSQEALARLLDSAADVAKHGGIAPETLQEHVRALSGMQRALLRAVAGTSWRAPRCGDPPARPWLAESVQPGGVAQ